MLQEHGDAKLSGSPEELMTLVERAQSGKLTPDRVTDMLSSASRSTECNSRSQLLMQLILLTQKLTSQGATTALHNQTHPETKPTHFAAGNRSMPDDITCPTNDGVLSLSAVGDSLVDANNENEMDKLMAWKNRIENASSKRVVAKAGCISDQTTHPPLPPQTEPVSQARPASPAVNCAGPRSANSLHTRVTSAPASPSNSSPASPASTSDVPSCNLLLNADGVLPCRTDGNSACAPVVVTKTVPLTRQPTVSPASPPADCPPPADHSPDIVAADYPPLPTPPKPPPNLLMHLDSHNSKPDVDSKPFVSSLPVPPTLSCGASDAVSPRHSHSSAVPSPDDVHHKPKVSNVTSGGHCPVTVHASDSHVPFITTDQSCVDVGNRGTETVCFSDAGVSSADELKPLSDGPVHHQLAAGTVGGSAGDVGGSADAVGGLELRRSTTTRLQSPSAWMSRLASPSAFMSHAGLSRLHTARPPADFASCKLADTSSTNDGHQVSELRSSCSVDRRRSDSLAGLYSVATAESNVSLDNFSDVEGSLQQQTDTDCRDTDSLAVQVRASQRYDDIVRMSTEKVLMRLAGMPPLDRDASSCDVASHSATETSVASRCSSADGGAPHREERNVASDTSDECDNLTAYTLNTVVEPSSAATAVCWRSVVCAPSADCVLSPSSTRGDDCLATSHDEAAPTTQDDDLEEGEIVDDCSTTPANSPSCDLPQATKQLLLFLKTDPLSTSSTSGRRRHDDRTEDCHKHHKTSSYSRRRW